MGSITVNFGLNTQEGTNNSLTTLSRSQVFSVANFAGTISEGFNIGTAITDMQISLVNNVPSKIIVIENTGTVELIVKINANTNLAMAVSAGGFFVWTTSTPVTSLFVTNASTTIVGAFRVFVGG